MSTLEVS